MIRAVFFLTVASTFALADPAAAEDWFDSSKLSMQPGPSSAGQGYGAMTGAGGQNLRLQNEAAPAWRADKTRDARQSPGTAPAGGPFGTNASVDPRTGVR